MIKILKTTHWFDPIKLEEQEYGQLLTKGEIFCTDKKELIKEDGKGIWVPRINLSGSKSTSYLPKDCFEWVKK